MRLVREVVSGERCWIPGGDAVGAELAHHDGIARSGYPVMLL